MDIRVGRKYVTLTQKERDARIKAGMEKGCSYHHAFENEQFLQDRIQMEKAGLI